MRKFRTALVAGGVAAVAVTALVAGSAQADPPSGVIPTATDIVGVGAQVTDPVFNQFSTDYNSTLGASDPHLYSYDAVGSATIPEKAGCAVNGTDPVRVNGANAGIAALQANAHPTGDSTHYCIDFARNSRLRASTDPASILFLPFAVDSVTWSTAATRAKPSHAPASLTTLQLKAIFSCDASILGTGHSGKVTWDEVGGTGTAAVVPVIPNSSSGTRTYFLSVIGVSTLGSCVLGQDNSVQQNEGTNAIFKGAKAPNVVFPYSVAVYLAQTVHNHDAGLEGNLVLRSVNGIAPTKGRGTTEKINVDFPFIRTVSNVVRNASTNGGKTVPAYLQAIFGTGALRTGWICKSAVAKADIIDYGFLPYPSGCGVAQ